MRVEETEGKGKRSGGRKGRRREWKGSGRWEGEGREGKKRKGQ